MCALGLGLRTAVLAGIDRDAFWDWSFATVVGAFLLSRAVLIAENVRTFLQFPMAILELPALSTSGLLVTAVFSFWYLRRRKIPMLGALDAGMPCAALQLGFMSAGLFADGTREGMPSTLPWAVGSSFGRVHPIEAYGILVWGAICLALLAVLRRRPLRGETAGFGLVLAGLANALLDFFRLPNVLYGKQILDGQQWRGVEMIVLGGVLLAWRYAVRARAARRGEEISRAI